MLRTANIKRPKGLEDLLDPELISRLNQIDIASRRVFAGKLKGERRSKKRGQSVEFADHRAYVVGDDLRHIDWNLYGRLDRLFLKLFLEEEDLSLHIIIDASASGDCGDPSKFLFMQKAAAALGYIGLVNLNRVAFTAIGSAEGGVVSSLRDLRGRRRLQEVVRWLCTLEPAGNTSFGEAAKRIAVSRRGRGVVVVLSDFFFKEGYDTGLRLLLGHGYDLFAIQVLSPQELEPNVGGDLRLKDVEDGDTAEVTISAPLVKKYKALLNAYCSRLHEFCVRRDAVHMTIRSDLPIETLVLDYLRRRGLLT